MHVIDCNPVLADPTEWSQLYQPDQLHLMAKAYRRMEDLTQQSMLVIE